MQQKKTIYSILSVMMAMIVLSVSLVLAIGPRVSAAQIDDKQIVTLSGDDFNVDEDGTLYGLKPSVYTDFFGLHDSRSNYYVNLGSGLNYDEINVIIPDNVKRIANQQMFIRPINEKITSIVLPNGLETIGQSAFYNCSNLKSINIPDTVTTIWENAFKSCYNLKVFIPSMVTTIEEGAFYGCRITYCETGCDDMNWHEYWRYYPERTIGDPYYIPYYLNNKTGCELAGDYVYQLNDDNTYTLAGYLGKEEVVTVPTSYNNLSVTAVADGAFAGCQITSVIIPAEITYVGEAAFVDCPNLTTIYCEATSRPDSWEQYWNWTYDWSNWTGYIADPNYTGYVDENGWEDTDSIEEVWGYEINYTVNFNVNGGKEINAQPVKKGTKLTTPETPVKVGYEFKGWYTDEALTNEYDFDAAVTDDVNLYAKWEAVQAQPEPTEPETPADENTEVNNQNNAGLIWGIAGTSAGVLIIAGIAVGIVITKRRRK